MIFPTNIEGRRVVAAFPCINRYDDRIVDTVYVTTDDHVYGAPGPFALVRVNDEGTYHFPETFKTLPPALRRARQSQGWG